MSFSIKPIITFLRIGSLCGCGVISVFGNEEAFSYEANVLPFIDNYCIDCHASDIRKGRINLEDLSRVGEVYEERKTWEKAYEQLKAGAMPPDDEYQPTESERTEIAAWLKERLEFVDTTKPIDPGRVTARRLNRREYDNTIQDLFGITLAPSFSFPTDDVGYGFDNIGDVHTVSPLRMELFLEAAERVSEFLVYTGQRIEVEQEAFITHFSKKNAAVSGAGAVFDQEGSMWGEFEAYLPGQYDLHIKAYGLMPVSVLQERGVDHKQTWPEHLNAFEEGDVAPQVPMQVSVNGVVVDTIQVEQSDSSADWKSYTTRIALPMGVHEIRFSLGDPVGLSLEELHDWKETQPRLGVRMATLVGPHEVSTNELHPIHRLIAHTRPSQDLSVDDAFREILLPVAERAYRRPLKAVESERLLSFGRSMVEQGDSFEEALSVALQAVLVSPQFLYRYYSHAESLDPETIVPIGDYAIASRLSYFLWGSMPDEELFALAEQEKLRDEATIRSQVARMLDHPRADHFKLEFFRQWLDLRKLDSLVINKGLFKAYSSELKADAETETLMFARSIIENNGSVIDLLKGEYTFLNDRLAKVYGMEGVEGSAFRKVSLEGIPRKGILTQPSILMLTSYPNRTSPTKRGNWILAAVLGDEPPDPPANVPTIEEIQAENPDLTLRDYLELHRTNQTCASCHATMDPIGLGLENYNAIGQWREEEEGASIDSSGELPGGKTFSDSMELLDVLMEREEDFVENFTRKLMTFALGRGLEFYDRIAVEEVMRKTRENDYRIGDIATEIVLSRPFLYQRGDPIREN